MKLSDRKGWHELADHTGKAPEHVAASQQLSFNDLLREPMQKQESFDQHLIRMINKAVQEDPRRLSHGNTKYNAFWIDGEKIIPFNKLDMKKIETYKGLISVHSHSPDNYKYLDDPSWKPEHAAFGKKLDPINFADVFGLHHMIKYGYGETIALISAYGELEYVQYTKETDPEFLRLSQRKMYKFDQVSSEQSTEYYDRTGRDQKDMMREILKDFCQSYKLIYKTGLRWK